MNNFPSLLRIRRLSSSVENRRGRKSKYESENLPGGGFFHRREKISNENWGEFNGRRNDGNEIKKKKEKNRKKKRRNPRKVGKRPSLTLIGFASGQPQRIKR